MAARQEPVFINGLYYDKFWKKNGCCCYAIKHHPDIRKVFFHTNFIIFESNQFMNLQEAKKKFEFCKRCEIKECIC